MIRLMRRYVLINKSKVHLIPYGFHWSHATKKGGAVLRDEVSWRNINGILISVKGLYIWILFRRTMLK